MQGLAPAQHAMTGPLFDTPRYASIRPDTACNRIGARVASRAPRFGSFSMSVAKAAPPTRAAIRARVRPLADARIADASQRFFKTGPGDYGHGDRFLGIRVPTLRKLAREFRAAPVSVTLALLRSPLHEERA